MSSKFLDKLLKADIPNPLGETQSGKPVLGAGQEAYSQGFKEQDHLDAKKIHEDKAAQAEKRAQTKMLSTTGKMPLKQIAQAQNQSAKQRDVAEWHEQQSGNSGESDEAKQIKENAKLAAQQNIQKAKFKQQLTGGLADNKKLSDFDKPSLMEGQQVEMEHTDDPEKALEIAMDHLTEDKEYYKKLKTIEKSVCKEEYQYPKEQECDWEEEAKKEQQSKEEDQVRAPSHVTGSFSLKKSFLEKIAQEIPPVSDKEIKGVDMATKLLDWLTKGGEGSRGGKVIGHTKEGRPLYAKAPEGDFQPRIPLPKREVELDANEQRGGKASHKPQSGWEIGYQDYVKSPAHGELTPEGKYKKLIQGLKKKDIEWDGHISFDPNTKKVKILTDHGKQTVKNLLGNNENKKD